MGEAEDRPVHEGDESARRAQQELDNPVRPGEDGARQVIEVITREDLGREVQDVKGLVFEEEDDHEEVDVVEIEDFAHGESTLVLRE